MVSRPSNVVRRRSCLTDVYGYADSCSMGIPPRCHASIWSASSDSSVLAFPLLEGPKTYSARRAGTGRSRGSHVHHKYTMQVLAAVPRTAPDSNGLAGVGPREHILRGSATRWLTNDSVLDTLQHMRMIGGNPSVAEGSHAVACLRLTALGPVYNSARPDPQTVQR